MQRVRAFLCAASCLLVLSGCFPDNFDPLHPWSKESNDLIDPDKKLSRDDFRNLNKLESYGDGLKVGTAVSEPPIPELAEILAAPRPPKIAETQLVSVSVTDDIPLKDVIIELARLADIDVEVDAGITGGVTFRAKDRPFNEVIDRLADLAGLRYRIKNNVLRVERDTPYVETYTLDMLNIDRNATGKIEVSSTGGAGGAGNSSGGGSGGGGSGGGRSGGGGGGQGGGGGGTSTDSSGSNIGSSSNITAESKSDFWAKFEDGIKNLLQNQRPVSRMSSAVLAPAPTLPGAPDAAAGVTPPAAAPVPAPVPLPVAAPVLASADPSFYTLNRQAGTLTVYTDERRHAMIKQFIDAIKSNSSSQVLIEAKIVEVALNDNYQTGVDWTKLGGTKVAFSGDLSSVTASDTARDAAQLTVLRNGLLNGLDLSAVVSLLDEFGTTRALASPRVNATNNQQAVMSFVENVIYFQIECEVTDAQTTTTTTTPAKLEITTNVNRAPVGIVLTLQPSINSETNEITLSVRPTLTKVTKFVPDPGFELCKANAASTLADDSPLLTTLQNTTSSFPQLETRELDSILKVKSGQVMVIGGLLEDRVINTDSGVPGLGEVPFFGNAFKNTQKTNSKKELVIFIRATVVSPHGSADAADKGVYEKFMRDPRPLNFQ